MKCPCCGSQEISDLAELGGPTKHICKTCGARVPKRGDPINRCRKCGEIYHLVEDDGDVTTFIHAKHVVNGELVKTRFCVVPTARLGGFVTGDTLLQKVGA
jgi:ribosomal protein L40E